jgi:transposase InsO family protein
MDFQFDARADGRRLKVLNVIDEHSRLCLAIRVGRRCKAKDVVAVLEDLTSLYPAPTFIRSDNGPEFISQALRNWCEGSGTATAFIEPGSPWENGFAESYELRSTSSTGRIRPSRGVRPWRQLNRELPHDHDHPL